MAHGGDIYSRKIDLDFSVNINPLGCPKAVKDAVRESLQRLDRYPDQEQRAARRALAELEGVDPEQVMCGSGASELFMALVRAFMPKRTLIPAPGFSGYRHALESVGCEILEYRLREEDGFALRDDIINDIREDMDMVFLTDPNNPTGKRVEQPLLKRITEACRKAGAKLVLDRCFSRMSDGPETIENLINDTIITVNAFTKLFCLPGLRVGYLISSGDNVSRIRRQLPEWNMSVPAQEAVTGCCRVLEDTGFEAETRALIRREREFLTGALRDMGIEVRDSDTCFLLLKSGADLYGELLNRGILIRDCSDFSGLDRGYFRIGVKDHLANTKLIESLKEIL